MNVISILDWIHRNMESLKPPVCNKIMQETDEHIVMMVGGKNERKDFHYNETEEIFFQIQGTLTLTIQEDNSPKDIVLKENDFFILPAKVLHRPSREENSFGIVIEKKRKATDKDGMVWFCQKCNHKMHEEYFHLRDIEIDLKRRIEAFKCSKHTVCTKCGHSFIF